MPPKQTKTTTTSDAAAPAPAKAVKPAAEPKTEVSAEASAEAPKPESKARKPKTPKPTETKAAEADAEAADVVIEDSTKMPRVPPTRESVLAEHSEILNLLEQEVNRLRENSDKASGVKFLRSIIRRVRNVQANSARVMKQKVPSARKNNNSGFLKPVKISSEMAKFTGLDPSGLHSRVDVTKFLCKYISDHNLQNPTDKRTINADPALSKLLNYDAKKSEKQLTYPHIQSLLKTHFKSDAAPAAPAATASASAKAVKA
jgi:chromatin remodeling complex protein RSC6